MTSSTHRPPTALSSDDAPPAPTEPRCDERPPPPRHGVTVREVAFAAAEAEIRAIRHEVFIVEQSVPETEEWDGLDPHCAHALARLPDGTPVGTARLAPGGKIGRMAVRQPYRGSGVGSALLSTLVARARAQGERRVSLAAQLQAIPFYERQGFRAHGPVFLDAGIEHREMTIELSADP